MARLDFSKPLRAALKSVDLTVMPWTAMGLISAAISNFFNPLAPFSLLGFFVCFVVAGILFLVIARSPETDLSTPPIRQYGNGLLISTLFCACFGTIYAWQKIVGDPPQGLIVTKVPELAALQQSLTGIKSDLSEILTSTTSAAKGIESLNKSIKRETSEDPRKELTNVGLAWSAQSFLDSVMIGDQRAINLYIAGGMRPDVRSGNSVMFYVIVNNTPDIEWTLNRFIKAGLDINKPLEIMDIFPTLYPFSRWKTPVYVAALNGKLDTLRLLARYGASTDAMVSEFKSLIASIDEAKAEEIRMQNKEYCISKRLKGGLENLSKFAHDLCLVDVEAYADYRDSSRGFRHTAEEMCRKSDFSFGPPPIQDYGPTAPTKRHVYSSALEALGIRTPPPVQQ